MTWLYAVQFAVPMILIGWLVLVPAHSCLGGGVQGFGSVAPVDGDPRPILFNGRFPVRGDLIEAR